MNRAGAIATATFLLILVIGAARSCTPQAPEGGESTRDTRPPDGPTTTCRLSDIEGDEWMLVEFAPGDPVPEGVTITLMVKDDEVTGTGGCNRYFGTITETEPGVISIGPIGATKRFCLGMPGNVETRFFKAIGTVSSISCTDGRLVLIPTSDDEAKALLFIAQNSQPEE